MTQEKNVLRQAQNEAVVEGYLKEKSFFEGVTKNEAKYLSANLTVQTGKHEETRVSIFATETKADGTENRIYSNLLTIREEYVALADEGVLPYDAPKEEEGKRADRVRVTRGQVELNEYFSKDGQLISNPQVSTMFINRLEPNDKFEPRATFDVEVIVDSVREEIKNDEETGRALVKAYTVLYGGRVIPLNFVMHEDASEYALANMEKGQTMRLMGDIVNHVEVKEREVEVAFGEPKIEKDYKTVRELLVKSGTQPIEEGEEGAYSMEALKKGLAERAVFLDDLEKKAKAKASAPKTATKTAFDVGSATTDSAGITGDDLPF